MTFATEDCSGISCIGGVYFLRGDEDDTGRAASSVGDATIVIARSIAFFSNDFELILSLFTINHFVHFPKRLDQGTVVFLLFVQFETLERLNKYLLHVLGNLRTFL